jgi:hypothetical protein
MTRRGLIIRIAVTLLVIIVGVPVLVIGAAKIGLDPRHWSGARLSAAALTPLSRQECPPRSAPLVGPRTEPDLEAVVDRIIADRRTPMAEGWIEPCHDRYLVVVRGLDHSTLARLSRYGDAVAVKLDPFAPVASTGVETIGPDPASVDRDLTAWPRDPGPLSTWFTLVTGFPLYLGGVIVALGGWWVLAIRRHRRKRRPEPAAAPAAA